MLRAIGAAEVAPRTPAPVRSKVEAFVTAQTALAYSQTHETYGVLRLSVTPVRPSEQADTPTGEMPAIAGDAQDVPAAFEQTDEERYKAALDGVAIRHATDRAQRRERAAIQENPPEDPMCSQLVRDAVRRLAITGDPGALDLMERYSDGLSGQVGMWVTRAAATWSPLRPLANHFPTWV